MMGSGYTGSTLISAVGPPGPAGPPGGLTSWYDLSTYPTVQDGLTAAAGKTAFLPAGLYTTENLTLPQNTTLILARGATLKLSNSASHHLLNLSNSGCSVIGEGTLDGNRANQSGNYMPISITAADCKLEDVTVINSKYYGVHSQTCSNLKVRRVKVSASNQAAIFVDASAANVTNVEIANCSIDLTAETAATTQAQGIYVYADTPGGETHERVRIVNNDVALVSNPTTLVECVVLTNVKGATVGNNTLTGGGIGVSLNVCTYCTVAANTVKSPAVDGLEFANSSGCCFIGNTVNGNNLTQYGISITNTAPERNIVSGNIVTDCTQAAMRMVDADYTAVTGNFFRHTVAGQTGVSVTTSQRIGFTGNTYYGGGTARSGVTLVNSDHVRFANEQSSGMVSDDVRLTLNTGAAFDYYSFVGCQYECATKIFQNLSSGSTIGSNYRIAGCPGITDA